MWAIVIAPLAVVAITMAGPTLGRFGDSVFSGVEAIVGPQFKPSTPFTLQLRGTASDARRYALAAPVTSPALNAKIFAESLPPDAVPLTSRADDFFLSGNSQTPVTIVSIQAVDMKYSPVISGTCIEYPSAGGGPADHETLVFDLKTGEAESMDGHPYFANRSINLSLGSRLVLTLDAQAAHEATTTWVYKVELLTPAPSNARLDVYLGKSGQFYSNAAKVPADERFAVTSLAPGYKMIYGPDDNNALALLPGRTLPPDP